MAAPVVDVPPVMVECPQQRVDELNTENQVKDLDVQIEKVCEQVGLASKRAAESCAALALAPSRIFATAFLVGDVGYDISGDRQCETIKTR